MKGQEITQMPLKFLLSIWEMLAYSGWLEGLNMDDAWWGVFWKPVEGRWGSMGGRCSLVIRHVSVSVLVPQPAWCWASLVTSLSFDRSCLREQSNTTLQIWCESQRVFTEHLAQALPPGRRRAHSEFEIRLWYYLATRLVVSLFNMRLCSYFTELVWRWYWIIRWKALGEL